jgi:hypothetical protein
MDRKIFWEGVDRICVYYPMANYCEHNKFLDSIDLYKWLGGFLIS